MKIKKFPQSHLIITNSLGKKLIIDPGYPTFEKGFKPQEFQNADAYLITHIHRDHVDSANIKEVVGDKPVYGNNDVCAALGHFFNQGINVNPVNNGDEFEVAGFKIKAFDLPHFPIGPNKPGPHNTGFLINGVFFHAGDGIKLEGLTSPNAAIPIAHPAITLEDSINFARSLKAKVVIPIHYDVYEANTEKLKEMARINGIEVRVLNFGEETEI
ncbi:MBL fold metallo-hydrolase [Candidatus Daviesbacteria bacterium]|nr:MBL fold metallo-hydrolase [Candidatus Daviesbacteria bacterium]